MVRFAPLELSLVTQGVAHRVVVPPYDSLSADERRELASSEPLSFLHALPAVEDDAGRAAAASGLARLRQAGVFMPEQHGLFVYRFGDGTTAQTGLVGGIAVDDLSSGTVLPHEQTRPDRVAGLVEYLEVVGAGSSPVAMTYRATERLDALVAGVTERSPDLHFATADGVEQTVWCVRGEASMLVEAAKSIPHLYITDGHHRVAAAIELGRRRSNRDGHDRSAWLLSVLFPDHDLRLHGFHRIVSPFPGVAALLEALRPLGIRPVGLDAVRPAAAGSCGLIAGDQSFVFELPEAGTHLPERLDPNRLQDHVLEPFLGVIDPGMDRRLFNLPGTVSIAELAVRAARGVAFVLHPVTMADFMAVSVMGASMPPKSTYFSPKPRSGVFLRAFD